MNIIIANVKQLRTGGSFRILLPFIRTSWSVGVLNSVIFNSFHNRVDFGTILESLRNFGGGGGGVETPKFPTRYATVGEKPHLLTVSLVVANSWRYKWRRSGTAVKYSC